MSNSDRRHWLGGYVRAGKRGPVFIIERWIDKNRFHVSTKCRSERAALKELERFEADPIGYRAGEEAAPRISCVITPELIVEFEVWLGQRAGRSHTRDCARYLEQWMDEFAGRDLRRLDLHRDIKAALDRWRAEALKAKEPKRRGSGAGRSRIVALKSFTAWLRREKGLLKRTEDPTLDLQVPQARPEKLRRRKAVPYQHVQLVLDVIREDCRDAVIILANTGLHASELRRFAADGELFEPTAEKRAEGARAMLAVKHKTGRLHVVALTTDEALDAAKRTRESRWAPSHSVIWFAMRDACDKAKVPRFNIGVMRHSVATWLHERGTPLAVISEQLGHRDPRTTADFYREMGGQARALPLPVLRVVK